MTTIARSVEPLIRPRASLKLQGYPAGGNGDRERSEEHTSELQSQSNLVCRLLLEKKKISHFSYISHKQFYYYSHRTFIFGHRPCTIYTSAAHFPHHPSYIGSFVGHHINLNTVSST